MLKKLLLSFAAILLFLSGFAQNYSISGFVSDQRDSIPAIGSTLFLISQTDTTQKLVQVSGNNGEFGFNNVSSGVYTLRVNYVGSKSYSQRINVLTENIQLGNIILQPEDNLLENVVVQGQVKRVEQLGDTTQFNAGAFKTNPDATAEDLLTKMPGVTSDGTGLKVNGETVKKIFVDGKPFFGDDPSVAVKNLPAEIIDKIQVFDRQNDQSQLTGFDDGNSEKTINILTKPGKNNGEFGRIYAGYGSDDRYSAGGSINYFNGARRVSLIGLSNNVNQQNFSSEDLLGVSSGGSSRGGRRGGGGGGAASNFMTGGQSGISKTNSVGLNFSDEWGEKIKISGSYFYNNTNNANSTSLLRDYYQDSTFKYEEQSTTESKNDNHRFNVRFEYKIDSLNSLFITPSLSVQNNNYGTDLAAISYLGEGDSSNITNKNRSNNNGFNLGNNLTFNHKFLKKGRTISLSANIQANDRSGDGAIYSRNDYVDSTYLLDQEYDLASKSHNLSGSVRYTEPIGKNSQLMVDYSPSFSKNTSNKTTNDYDSTAEAYNIFNSTLSNKYENTYNRHSGGMSYRFNNRTINFSMGVSAQSALLQGDQDFPYDFTLEKQFTNVLPNAMFNYRPAKGENLRIMYRTGTNAPSISQLQNVVDITNPLLLRTGNPDLKQDFEHRVFVHYGKTNTEKASSFFLFGNLNVYQDYVGNATFIPTKDSSVSGVTVSRGGQISLPVNINGYINARTFATYSLPINLIKSNLNLSGGFSYGKTPSIINTVVNYSSNYAPNIGIVLSSNVSENIDFTVAYNGNYNVIRNTAQANSNNNYYNHNVSVKLNVILLKHLVLNTNINQNLYSGLNEGYNQQYLLWNAYVGYKFLKNRAMEARVTAFDLLKQNQSINVNNGDIYREQTTTQVLTRYFLFTLNYTFRYFKSGNAPSTETQDENRPRSGRRDWGGPPRGRD